MAQLTESVTKVIEELSKLPGIGRKSAERLTYHLLRVPKEEAVALADAIRGVRENVRYCKTCFHLAEGELCEICLCLLYTSPSPRDNTTSRMPSSA